jgi:hypothetical protein
LLENAAAFLTFLLESHLDYAFKLLKSTQLNQDLKQVQISEAPQQIGFYLVDLNEDIFPLEELKKKSLIFVYRSNAVEHNKDGHFPYLFRLNL